MARKKASGTGPAGETPIEALLHKDTRKNIPTREQGEYLQDEEEAAPQMLYPRDPTLDPQLVWKGKDEQDRKDLAVPVVPIYIQETIHPKALVEDLRSRAAGTKPQLDLFATIKTERDFEEQVEFYQHDDHWRNRMILGDSLVVMTSLAQKEGLRGKVQMIYMDPPYGIKFGSNWQVSTRKREVKDGKIEDLVRQPEQIKAFRDTWELGIHSYLTYLRDRFSAARELLTETGSIFVQIGDENVHLLRSILDEAFGSSNFIAQIAFAKTSGSTEQHLPSACDYLLWYGKNKSETRYRPLYLRKEPGRQGATGYTKVRLLDGRRAPLSDYEEAEVPNGARIYALGDITSQSIGRDKGEGAACWFPVELDGQRFLPSSNVRWKTNEVGMSRLLKAARVEATSGSKIGYVRYLDDFAAFPVTNMWLDTVGQNQTGGEKVYVVQTALKVVQRCILMTTDPGDLVLDPTCGSGTTSTVAEEWGRRWIVVDTSRVAIAVARARLISAQFKYYLLADEGEAPARPQEVDLRHGFLYSRVPHIMLSSIAHNEEIDTIHARYQAQIDPLRATLNKLLKKKFEEWEIPREAESAWSSEAKAAHAEWWQLRRARQKEIDASIARRAESEILYDQPEEDKKRVRVSGPFTVESLSPHRTLDAGIPQPKSAATSDAGSFVTTILDNLKKAGVQNTVKNERLTFDRLNIFPGRWICGDGEITDKTGTMKRVAVCIGPEHGTVSPELVRNAAKEALKGFDLAVVCGFAFDPLAYEAAKEFAPKNGNGNGKTKGPHAETTITVLLSRMNPDLAMGDELLKKTGAGNLFMVFGEPDLAVEKTKDGKLTVELRGLDVYDPTTGEVRSHSTADVACWFIDTDYDGDSFFVRHAYFTGANDPYEKLKRALKAEIDEATWATLYTTKSRPFDTPKTGYFAVKVINHYGDEVLKVYPVR